MIDRDFLSNLKRITESRWKNSSINPDIYGFQIQPGTKWNPGLPAVTIAEYEADLQVCFPHDFKALLAAMNGTDLPTLNVYGSCGEPHQHSTGVYSYPGDLEVVKWRMEDIERDRSEIVAVLADQGFDLPEEGRLIPVFFHRFVLCEPDLDRSVVLSIYGTDAIVYGDCLQEYLEKEFVAA